MNLVIDSGNSFCKLSVFDADKIIYFNKIKLTENKIIIDEISKLKNNFEFINKVIFSSVRNNDFQIISFLENEFDFAINLSEKTRLPIKNLYKTPDTLGKDRLAAVVAGNYLFPENNVLIFDAGTALTIDFINNKAEYSGGNISPGLEMRYKALNTFTAKLPVPQANTNFEQMLGNTTETAVWAGVRNGILFEVQSYINIFDKEFSNLKVIFTGGDNIFFVDKLKKNIFADSHLVLKGLNRILEYNAK